MSDAIKHECGIVLLRLLKPLEYYTSHYGSAFYALNKLYLLMEKQHNRGQDGAGIGCIKFGVQPGNPYISRLRSNSPNPINDIFDKIHVGFEKTRIYSPERLADTNWLKNNSDFIGELYLGHLRYGTFGQNSIENVHPFLRQNNWMSKTLMIAGNFNLTNVGELFESLVKIGQHPNATSDTVTILEKLGHFLDEENEDLYQKFKSEGFSKRDISPLIAQELDLKNVLTNASKHWDGGYVIAGMVGHGDSFVMRDPAGIRPAYYYHNDDFLVAASERSAIRTALNAPRDLVKEVKPGHALIIKQNGSVSEVQICQPLARASCSFERIYLSRGTDSEIYQERKNLGRRLVPAVLNSVNHDLENTLFSYIPNTAIAAFKGMVEELNNFCDGVKKEKLLAAGPSLDERQIDEILSIRPRVDQVTVKDAQMRTFITPDSVRDDLVAHVYDVTYGVVRRGKDNLVVVDDSIVRGTTLKKSIVRMLDRLGPKKIVVVSSAPQIRYPDCYGIDMARLGDLIAFRATLELLNETGQGHIINEVYLLCKEQAKLPNEQISNNVKLLYEPFCPTDISKKIADILHPPKVKADLEIVYQTIEDLHAACPQHTGDWYFTGNYPTPGGNRVANQSLINFIEGRKDRAY